MLVPFPSFGLSSARRRRVSGEAWLVCMVRKLPRTAPSSHTSQQCRDLMTQRQWVILAGVAALTAAAGVMHYAGASPTATFFVAGIALGGLAWIVSFATEQVGPRVGAAVTRVVQC